MTLNFFSPLIYAGFVERQNIKLPKKKKKKLETETMKKRVILKKKKKELKKRDGGGEEEKKKEKIKDSSQVSLKILFYLSKFIPDVIAFA